MIRCGSGLKFPRDARCHPGPRVLARIDNPYIAEHANRAGNRMALENIRERLQLFFDAEARIETRVAGARYVVEIEMPYRATHA